MADALLELAEAAGFVPEWDDFRGRPQRVAPETLRAVLTSMEVPCEGEKQTTASLAQLREERARPRLAPLVTAVAGAEVALPLEPGSSYRLSSEDGTSFAGTLAFGGGGVTLLAPTAPGYYRLESGSQQTTLAVAPTRAFGVTDAAPGRRIWGLATQLYALRRAGDGGVGDYTALAELATRAGALGADALAVSPVHAPFVADPQLYSPYAPSSRLFLNPWHVDPADFAGPALARAVAARLGLAEDIARLETLPLVDWPEVARSRHAWLRGLYEELRAGRVPGAAAKEFEAFRARAGGPLADHACFDALHAHQLAAGGPWHWRQWPAELRDPRAPAVARFAREHADDVRFHAFLQWLADRGLAQARDAARSAGMAVGLIADLAIGTDGGGSQAWGHQHDMLVGLSVGAPPDELNGNGQSWGLTTFSPRALEQHGYAPFLEMLRASLRHAGGLRIDHVLGLNRMWLVPEGAPPAAGVYLRYPLDDLLRLIALESWRHRAIVVGEDLGTVPNGFRDRLRDAGILGMRVLWFERDHELFVEPGRWPAHAMATTSTHDLATVASWWDARDIGWRERLGLPGETREQRARDRRALWNAFRYAGVADGSEPADAGPVADAAVHFVARTPAELAILPLEDVAALPEQPNLPGTRDEHPNWRRRLPMPAPELLDEPAVAARLAAVRRERPAP